MGAASAPLAADCSLTVHRTVAFSIPVLVFSVVEHVLGALWAWQAGFPGSFRNRRMRTGRISRLVVADQRGVPPSSCLQGDGNCPGVDKVRGLFFRSPRNPAGSPEGTARNHPTLNHELSHGTLEIPVQRGAHRYLRIAGILILAYLLVAYVVSRGSGSAKFVGIRSCSMLRG